MKSPFFFDVFNVRSHMRDRTRPHEQASVTFRLQQLVCCDSYL